jgi:hypothetical protein
MLARYPRFTLAALIALSSPLALVHPTMSASAQSADRISYVLLSEDGQDSTMSGTGADMERARALRAGRGALLYARLDGVAYVVRDPATLARARAIFEPQRRLGARQGALGARQGALGARQGALGAEQGRLGARMANASPRQARALSAQQSELGRRQSELGRQQAALGAQQAELGREQARLGREAQAQLRMLLTEAIRSGAARRVD